MTTKKKAAATARAATSSAETSSAATSTSSAAQKRRRRTPEERRALEAETQACADRREQRRLVLKGPAVGPSGIKMPGPSEPTTLEVGASAEESAVRKLEAHGYEIVERNYRCDIGEIDIVAIDGDVMAFVEVRSRSDDEHGDAIESVNRRKQRKVTQVAEVYLVQKRPGFVEYRFDVVAINNDRVDLYQDAWRGGLLR